MTIIDTTAAEHYFWGNEFDAWHLANTAGLSVVQERVPSGGTEVRHAHRYAHQFFFVLRGTATMRVDETEFTLREHQGIEIPPGTPHQFINRSGVDVEFLVISSPHSRGDRITFP